MHLLGNEHSSTTLNYIQHFVIAYKQRRQKSFICEEKQQMCRSYFLRGGALCTKTKVSFKNQTRFAARNSKKMFLTNYWFVMVATDELLCLKNAGTQISMDFSLRLIKKKRIHICYCIQQQMCIRCFESDYNVKIWHPLQVKIKILVISSPYF